MRPQPLFIVLEGLDGSGKSTLAKKLASLLASEQLATPLRELQGVRKQVDGALDGTPLARVLWYAAQVARVSEQVRQHRQAGRAVVLDRYWLSTLAYARLQGQPLVLPEVGSQLLEPDLTFYLDVRLEIRALRLAQRTSLKQETLQPHDQAGLDIAGDRLLKQAYFEAATLAPVGHWIPLSISQESPEELLTQVMDHVARFKESQRNR